mmetsp:Transcript_27201/g.63175  ORF Transcript_27201/g.63175 Transcript_27201/m.63175 type:complete len:229 (-) Transcript_27201:2609-3295(-)
MHASRRTQWTSAFALLLCILPGLPVQVLCDRRVSCPNDSDLRGYTSIADINHDMLATEIQNNDPSTEKSSFRFTLCPDTYFDGHEKLTPLLANSSFVCGRNGDSKDNCTIVGGHMQVEILPSDRVVESVDFQGITFANFTGYGVAALATKETRAEFRDCHWKVSFFMAFFCAFSKGAKTNKLTSRCCVCGFWTGWDWRIRHPYRLSVSHKRPGSPTRIACCKQGGGGE